MARFGTLREMERRPLAVTLLLTLMVPLVAIPGARLEAGGHVNMTVGRAAS